jgi:hypothetical protein
VWLGGAHITAGFHASPTKPGIPSCDPGPHLFSIGLEQLLWQQARLAVPGAKNFIFYASWATTNEKILTFA